MIRTHRPRGYQWSGASEFQQTELFRDISFDEAEAVDGEPLLSDSEDDFPLSDRIMKRRRIEKLADDFLNGEELNILSARLDARALYHSLTWSFERVSTAKSVIDEIEWDQGIGDTWEDVEDDWECMKRRHIEQENIEPMYHDLPAVVDSMSMEEELLVEVHQSSCQRRKSQRIAKIAFGPSEGALQKAAELRDRKLRNASSKTVDRQLPQSCPRIAVQDSQLQPESTGANGQDSFSDCGPTPTPAWTSAMWRDTGAFRPPRKSRPNLKPVDQDCSRDELGLSSFSIPSQAARVTGAKKQNAEGGTGTQDSHGPATALILSAELASSPASESNGHKDHNVAMSTINEQSDEHVGIAIEHDVDMEGTPSAGQELENDSQDRLLKQQGILARPRKSWATMNGPQALPPDPEDHVESTAEHEGMGAPRTTASILVAAESMIEKPRKPRGTKSAGGTPVVAVGISNRRKSAPSESQKVLKQLGNVPANHENFMSGVRMKYNESVGGKNSSPFVFRKRVTKFAEKEEATAETIVARKIPTPAVKPAKTPRRQVNFGSSDTPEREQLPRTPLTDEHINQRLPQSVASERDSGCLRSSLRQELIASGAKITRVEESPSPQPLPSASREARLASNEDTVVEESFIGEEVVENDGNNVSDVADISQQIPNPPQLWPGTQDMLAQAQHELFTSPAKHESTLPMGDHSTSQWQPAAGTRERRPLGALSQEPVPSTQALLQNWEGWSSIKKPRQPGADKMVAPSPTATRGNPRMALARPESFEINSKRRSSLRFSMSFSQDSPVCRRDEQPSLMPAQSTDLVPATGEPGQSQTWPRPSGKIASSASFGTGLSSSEVTAAIPSRSAPSTSESVRGHLTGFHTPVDATTVSLSFGASAQALVQPEDSHRGSNRTAGEPRSPPKDKSAWRSPQAVEAPEPFLFEEESLITELSFGPPDVQADSVGEGVQSYVMYQNAQRVSQYDSQELRSTMNELVDNVLGTASTFSF